MCGLGVVHAMAAERVICRPGAGAAAGWAEEKGPAPPPRSGSGVLEHRRLPPHCVLAVVTVRRRRGEPDVVVTIDSTFSTSGSSTSGWRRPRPKRQPIVPRRRELDVDLTMNARPPLRAPWPILSAKTSDRQASRRAPRSGTGLSERGVFASRSPTTRRTSRNGRVDGAASGRAARLGLVRSACGSSRVLTVLLSRAAVISRRLLGRLPAAIGVCAPRPPRRTLTLMLRKWAARRRRSAPALSGGMRVATTSTRCRDRRWRGGPLS